MAQASPAHRCLIIACGALAREIICVLREQAWDHVKVTCLPADLHNRPQQIPAAVAAKLAAAKPKYDKLYVAYADCGTGGQLDQVLQEYGAERLPGAHCYSVFAGELQFEALMEAEPGSFFLTDFLVRHFERVMWQGLGLDRHPELLPSYFGHYRRLVYLAQLPTPELESAAQRAASRLGLEYELRVTGLAQLQRQLVGAA